MHDDNPHISIAVGVTVGLLSSFVQSLGLTIQRKSHVQNHSDPYNRLWLLGFAIFISSNVLGSLFQIASLPVVILAPLGAVSLLWNAFFARIILGDVFSLWMILGTIQIAGGAVLIAIFGIIPEDKHSLEDLLSLFRRPAFIIYFSILGVVITLLLAATHTLEFSINRIPAPPFRPATNGAVSERTPLLDHKLSRTFSTSSLESQASRSRFILSMSYASMSGILSGMCLIFAKSGVELLELSIFGKNQFWKWEAWVLVGLLVVFALLQLWYLQKALVFAGPTIVCPLAFCFYNVSSIVNGLVYFNQLSALSTANLFIVTLGMVILLGGVWVVSIHAGGGGVDVGTWNKDTVACESPPAATVPVDPRLSNTLNSPEQLDGDQFMQSSAAQRNETDSEDFAYLQGRGTRPRYHSFLQPLDVTDVNLPGGGLSIGLSPVSPGFALLPRHRRDQLHWARMVRRTVSEGGHGAHHIDHSSSESEAAKGRWKWLKSMVEGGG